MDHSLKELDSCIFDFLVDNHDQLKSFEQIFTGISGDTGHRCSALKDEANKNKFLALCFTLDVNYNNIHKIFVKNEPYLIYSTKSKLEIHQNFNIYFKKRNLSLESNTFDIINIVNYIIDNVDDYSECDFYCDINENESLIEYLIKLNKVDMVTKILNLFYIDLSMKNNNGKSLLDIAIDNNNGLMVFKLMEIDYDDKILELNTYNNELKEYNAKLLQINNKFNMEISKHKSSKLKFQISLFFSFLFFGLIFLNKFIIFS